MKVLCVLNNRKFVVDIVISQAVNALDKPVKMFFWQQHCLKMS